MNVLHLHQRIYEKTNGRLGHRLIGPPTLLLRTRGRRTGCTRTNALVYARDDDDVIVVASNGGRPAAPAWLLNLTAHPAVEFQISRTRQQAHAQPVYPEHGDYDRLLSLCDGVNHGRFSRYRQLTTRPIPVVLLSPGTYEKSDGTR